MVMTSYFTWGSKIQDLVPPLAMEEVFSNYEMKNRIGTHTTTMGPQNILTVRRWLRKNTNINFSTLKNLVGNIPGLGSLGFGK